MPYYKLTPAEAARERKVLPPLGTYRIILCTVCGGKDDECDHCGLFGTQLVRIDDKQDKPESVPQGDSDE